MRPRHRRLAARSPPLAAHSRASPRALSPAVDAFIALGGNADKTGNVQADKLRGIIKEFGLTIDIDRLIREVDTDHSGLIDYQEFAVMMKG